MPLNLASKKTVKDLFKKSQSYPARKFGQNFLIDRLVLKKFVKEIGLQAKDVVLEIGPGIGTITEELARRAKRVIAIEKDLKMAEILKETLKDFNNVEIIIGDILKIPDTKHKILNTEYKVAANLPFNIASPVIRKFLESKKPPKEMVFFVQKEVAQRICSQPPGMNLLAVQVQFYAKPEIIIYVSKRSFWPQPKVDSAIVRIVPKKLSQKPDFVDLFFKIVRAGFSHPRKQILNNLSKVLKLDKEKTKFWLLKNGIRPEMRAETLTIENWVKLAETLNFSNVKE